MLSWDERLMIGLKVLERLRPTLRNSSLSDGAAHTIESTASDRENNIQGTDEVEFARSADTVKESPTGGPELPSLEALLEQTGELSPYSVVLGICDDGLPFLLDLTNPAPGAMLLAADPRSGKTRLLKSLLAAATYLNSPDEVSFYVVAQYPWQYAELEQTDHCQGLQAAKDSSLGELIEELARMVEERKHTGPNGPAIILAIDDLHTLLQYINEQTFARLYWLIRHGPRSRIWTFATLSTYSAGTIDPRFLAAFRTHLMGKVTDRRQASTISGDAHLDTRHLDQGYEFCVPYGEDWIHFWICESEDLIPPDPEETEEMGPQSVDL
jgi:hypothetical protein